jgi:hypothetical protein
MKEGYIDADSQLNMMENPDSPLTVGKTGDGSIVVRTINPDRRDGGVI